ncbi:transcriptional regulator, TetR family [Amycolatopsis marina]|uniref:Transcriptional regulator, TetR family n=1 Tax=Amycolatopsis marina TaxID=490629 RepID=A0A1I1CIE1_9PSEU|nr:TetR family transcriptional regulator [Amycolatopsis marina]SFB62294.1 transcriptional regulator, TetR family [Amycolatopsis marina]
MGRPRKISDDELMAACGRAIGRYGPGFTLAQVAAEAGVAVGTVSGRFGSKHGLLVAMMTAGGAGAAQRMRSAADRHRDPAEAILAAVLVAAEGVDDPATTTNHLAQLGVDMSDPDLRDGLVAMRAEVRAVLRSLLAAAALPSAPPPARAARIIAALAHGTQLDWALSPTGKLRDRLRGDVRAVLDAWSGPDA